MTPLALSVLSGITRIAIQESLDGKDVDSLEKVVTGDLLNDSASGSSHEP
jgi:hypothetical protein